MSATYSLFSLILYEIRILTWIPSGECDIQTPTFVMVIAMEGLTQASIPSICANTMEVGQNTMPTVQLRQPALGEAETCQLVSDARAIWPDPSSRFLFFVYYL